MSSHKIAGCCSVCDAPCFEVLERYTQGPRRGEPKVLGRPLPGARRVTVARMSGRQTDWTFCGDCEMRPEDVNRVMHKEMNAMLREQAEAKDTPEQAELRGKMLRLFYFDAPLGKIAERSWLEVS